MGGGGCWHYVGEIEANHTAAIVPITASGLPTLVEMINAANPLIPAKITVFPETGHNSWSKTYRGTGMFTGDFRLDQYNMNIYDWILQYRKNDF